MWPCYLVRHRGGKRPTTFPKNFSPEERRRGEARMMRSRARGGEKKEGTEEGMSRCVSLKVYAMEGSSSTERRKKEQRNAVAAPRALRQDCQASCKERKGERKDRSSISSLRNRAFESRGGKKRGEKEDTCKRSASRSLPGAYKRGEEKKKGGKETMRGGLASVLSTIKLVDFKKL